MGNEVLRVFLWELQRQCRFGLRAFQDLRSSLERGDTDLLWYSVQAILISAGNVSKLLWPAAEQFQERGQTLRTLLSVPEESPIAPRTFRNHFEHFDERLEHWANMKGRGAVVDSNVGPTGMFGGFEPAQLLRNFDTSRLAVTFRGDVYELPPIETAFSRLWEEAETAFRNSFRQVVG